MGAAVYLECIEFVILSMTFFVIWIWYVTADMKKDCEALNKQVKK
jgi:hypothetical protein